MVRNSGYAAALAVTGLAVLSSGAIANDKPAKAPATAIIEQKGNWYIWADGAGHSINLPSISLGYHLAPLGGLTPDLGSRFTDNSSISGPGFSGAIGHIFPGTGNTRLELGGSYIQADAAQTSSTAPLSTLDNVVQVQLNLNGFIRPGGVFGCGLAPGCHTNQTLHADYQAWQINGKLAHDFAAGPVTLTPSVVVFGGHARTRYAFGQQLRTDSLPTGADYSANIDIGWTDWGGKIGMDATIPLMPSLAFGLGGQVGTAHRQASLSGSDSYFGFATGTVLSASSVSTDRSTAPLLANAEARLILTPSPTVTIKGFAGLNYDSRVPGMSSPGCASGVCTVGTTGTPAGIKFESETSWYAGGGLIFKFGS
jgi:hypothetical protein